MVPLNPKHNNRFEHPPQVIDSNTTRRPSPRPHPHHDRTTSSSPLKDLLEGGDENLSVPQLLEEVELLQEVVSHNIQLIDYLCKEECLVTLVAFAVGFEVSVSKKGTDEQRPQDDVYVLTPLPSSPPSSSSSTLRPPSPPSSPSSAAQQLEDYQRRTVKYPYMSCEVLCCENEQILNGILDAVVTVKVAGNAARPTTSAAAAAGGGGGATPPPPPAAADNDAEVCYVTRRVPLLSVLFHILDTPGTLSPHYAGYFYKALLALHRRRVFAVKHFIEHVGGEILFNKMLDHMGNVSVMSALKGLITPRISLAMFAIPALVGTAASKTAGDAGNPTDPTPPNPMTSGFDLFLLDPSSPRGPDAKDPSRTVDLSPHPTYGNAFREAFLIPVASSSSSGSSSDSSGGSSDDDDFGAAGATGMGNFESIMTCGWANDARCVAGAVSRLLGSDDVEYCLNAAELVVALVRLMPLRSEQLKSLSEGPSLPAGAGGSVPPRRPPPLLKLIFDAAVPDNEDALASSLSVLESKATAAMSVLEAIALQLGGYGSINPEMEEERVAANAGAAARVKAADATYLAELLRAKLPSVDLVLRHPVAEAWSTVDQTLATVPRLGTSRLKLVRVVEALVLLASEQVDAGLITSPLINTCLDLFFEFESCSMLHQSVANLLVHIYEGGHARQALQRHILIDCKLLSRVLDAFGSNERRLSTSDKRRRLGYMGHVIIVAQTIVQACTEDDPHDRDDWATSPTGSQQRGHDWDNNGNQQQSKQSSNATTPDSPITAAAAASSPSSNNNNDNSVSGAPTHVALLLAETGLEEQWSDFVMTTLASETAVQSTHLGGGPTRDLMMGDDSEDLSLDNADLDMAVSIMENLNLARAAAGEGGGRSAGNQKSTSGFGDYDDDYDDEDDEEDDRARTQTKSYYDDLNKGVNDNGIIDISDNDVVVQDGTYDSDSDEELDVPIQNLFPRTFSANDDKVSQSAAAEATAPFEANFADFGDFPQGGFGDAGTANPTSEGSASGSSGGGASSSAFGTEDPFANFSATSSGKDFF